MKKMLLVGMLIVFALSPAAFGGSNDADADNDTVVDSKDGKEALKKLCMLDEEKGMDKCCECQADYLADKLSGDEITFIHTIISLQEELEKSGDTDKQRSMFGEMMETIGLMDEEKLLNIAEEAEEAEKNCQSRCGG